MKIRSLDKDSAAIAFGQALLLINVHLTRQQSSTPFRTDFFDEKNERHFSIEGNKREIEMLNTLYQLVGPMIPAEMLSAVPGTFMELRNRRSSAIAYRQGIVHVLQNIYSMPVPDYWESDTRAFHKWLHALKVGETNKP